MPDIEVNKMWSRDAFEIKTDRGFRKTATIQTAYQIVCHPTTTEIELSQFDELPESGSEFPELPEMRAATRSFQRISPTYWICQISYEGYANDPLEDPPEVSWSDVESTEAIDEDWDGNPIVTVNGEPIDGVTMQIADNVLTVRRKYRAFSPWLTSQYRHSVNIDTFQEYPPGTGRLTKFSATQIFERDQQSYWNVTATIQFRYPYNTTPEKAWYARVRHEGYYEKLSDGRIVRAVDDNGENVTRPVLLKEDGTRETDPEQAHWLEFKRYEPLPYNALGLL